MKIGTEAEADKKDSEADPFTGFISGSYCFLPLGPFSARGVLIKEGRQLLCWDSKARNMGLLLSSRRLHLSAILSALSPFIPVFGAHVLGSLAHLV